jgi:hypothetical protein
VFLLRSTPLSLLGLALLVPARRSPRLTRTAIVLAAYPLGFGLIMTVAAKNIDRYLLPSFPILDVLAGLGFWLALTRLAPRHRQWGLTILAASIVGLSAWWVAGAWPYVLTYANPLVGGPSVATPRIASGWGEGLDQVAAYLNRRPNAERLKIGMPGESYTTVLGAQVRGQVVPADGSDAGKFDYVVVYLRNLEIDQRPPFFDERYLRWTPEAIISVGGIDYAWIYRSAVGAPVGAIFGDLVELEGYGLESVTGRLGRSLGVHLRWRPRRPIPPNLQVLVELRPSAGGPAHSYTFPLKPVDSAGWPTNELASASYPVMVDRLASPGAYVLAVRVLDGQGHPLALTRGSSLGPEATPEPDAIALRGIEIR